MSQLREAFLNVLNLQNEKVRVEVPQRSLIFMSQFCQSISENEYSPNEIMFLKQSVKSNTTVPLGLALSLQATEAP